MVVLDTTIGYPGTIIDKLDTINGCPGTTIGSSGGIFGDFLETQRFCVFEQQYNENGRFLRVRGIDFSTLGLLDTTICYPDIGHHFGSHGTPFWCSWGIPGPYRDPAWLAGAAKAEITKGVEG